MLVYVLSNTDKTLGVFSTQFEARKYYSTLTFTEHVKLEEFTLNSTIGKDITVFLKKKSFEENIFKPKLNYYQGKFKSNPFYPHDIFEPIDLDIIEECDNCGGEDCVRDKMCCND